MRTDIHIGFFDVFVFLGVFQGLFLSWFFIRNGYKQRRANLYQGLLLLALSLAIFEELLNNTGLIVRVLWISNYSEPLNFAFAPLVYLYIKSSLSPTSSQKDNFHFIAAFLWLLYMLFYFIQPEDVKYNSYLGSKHPDWEFLSVVYTISEDPLGIRNYINELTSISFVAYITISILYLQKKLKSTGQSFFKVETEQLRILRNAVYHFTIIISIFIFTKIYFGRDIGDYFIASYISFMIYATSYQVLKSATFFNQPHFFMEFPKLKYQKSSLTETNKASILAKIKDEMETNGYFANNMASLADLSKRIHESPHHVSQTINEKLGNNFFELLAQYRVEEAKRLIQEDVGLKLTVEELAERVGYNSKSSFNNAFKKLTLKTPSEFRGSNNV